MTIKRFFPLRLAAVLWIALALWLTAPGAAHADSIAAARNYFAETERLTTRLRDALPGNRALIDHIRQHGLPTI